MNLKRNKTVLEISWDWGFAVKAGQKPPALDLGNLLDDFRCQCTTPEEKLALVSDPPEPTGEPQTDACFAAMVESLCREASLNPPALDGVAIHVPAPALVCWWLAKPQGHPSC